MGALDGINKKEEPKLQITLEEVEGDFKKGAKPPVSSSICMGIYGEDGTAKSGIVMDTRTEEEVKQGLKVIIIDLDDSNKPLKKSYHNNDENIIILNPLSTDAQNHIDYSKTYMKIFAYARYLREVMPPEQLKAVCVDGLDAFLKMCEYVMKIEDLKIDPGAQIKQAWDWEKRNRRYFDVVELLKSLPCEKYFITHTKEVKKFDNGQMVSNITDTPSWHPKTSDMMYQKVRMERLKKKQDGMIVTKFVATVEKSKTNLSLEGATFTVGINSIIGTGKDLVVREEWVGLMAQVRDCMNDPKKRPIEVKPKVRETKGTVKI